MITKGWIFITEFVLPKPCNGWILLVDLQIDAPLLLKHSVDLVEDILVGNENIGDIAMKGYI